jgi:N-methylhydantoinase A
MSYRLGVDVGGTFTDLVLIDEDNGDIVTAKVPSTPEDSSIGVLNGINKLCTTTDRSEISHVMHGTTVATNAVLTGNGAKVGLITTRGYKQILHIARSHVPGGLGAWINYKKSRPIAPLKWTIEVTERMDTKGEVVTELDEDGLRKDMLSLRDAGVEAITVVLINSFANGAHEQRVRDIVESELPGIAVSISSEVVPEMQEYERAITAVINSYVRPTVEQYLVNLRSELDLTMPGVTLNILRSDGGLASASAAEHYPVNLLMSGPAGGVSGASWVASHAGFENFMTFDMGGTSTDVALVEDGKARLRRETTVGDITVRASSVDVRTVGAGGGSIAHVPELTGALRVGPQSAGAVPGPAAYCKGGEEPTVTDANVVLGYLPDTALLGGDMRIDKARAEAAVQKIADAMGLTLKQAAAGIIDIVNENMFGALRLISVEQGYDPRDFALMGFGGAGPLHANALAKLAGSWPVIIPRGPGVLCAYGDATTRMRDEASRTYIRKFSETTEKEVAVLLEELAGRAQATLDAENVPRNEQTVTYQADVRYQGQAFRLTIDFSMDELMQDGFEGIGSQFDDLHEKQNTFRSDAGKELLNLRAVVEGDATFAKAQSIPVADGDPKSAKVASQEVYVDNADHTADVFDRSKLRSGDQISGPAIVTEMDSTLLILPRHVGTVDTLGNILIRPADAQQNGRD